MGLRATSQTPHQGTSVDPCVSTRNMCIQLNMKSAQRFVRPACFPVSPAGVREGAFVALGKRREQREHRGFGSCNPLSFQALCAHQLFKDLFTFLLRTNVNIKLIICILQNPTFSAFWKVRTLFPSQSSATPIWQDPRWFAEASRTDSR